MKPNAQLKREEAEAQAALEVTASMLRRHVDNGALFRIAENYDAPQTLRVCALHAKGLVDTFTRAWREWMKS